MASHFVPFPGPCDDEPRNVIDAIGTITLDVSLSGTVTIDAVQAATCTPSPRPYTLVLTGSAGAEWTRQNIHTPSPTLHSARFSISRTTCVRRGVVAFATDAAQVFNDAATVTCDAPLVTCITPPSIIPVVSTSTDLDLTISLFIDYVDVSNDYTVTLLCELSPSIGCIGSGGATVSQFLKEVTGLSLSSAYTGRTETKSETIGDGTVDCEFTLAFA